MFTLVIDHADTLKHLKIYIFSQVIEFSFILGNKFVQSTSVVNWKLLGSLFVCFCNKVVIKSHSAFNLLLSNSQSMSNLHNKVLKPPALPPADEDLSSSPSVDQTLLFHNTLLASLQSNNIFNLEKMSLFLCCGFHKLLREISGSSAAKCLVIFTSQTLTLMFGARQHVKEF